MIKLMIVDDHKMFRDGLRNIFDSIDDMAVIAESSNGIECLDLLVKNHPDVILLDINMPEMDGFETLYEIKKVRRYIYKVLMMTADSNFDMLYRTLKLGADGFILKSSDSKELISAIRTIYKGEKFVQQNQIPLLNSKLLTKDAEKEKIDLLTNKELEILKLVAMGNSNKEIGYKLHIQERTVKNHLSSIYRKLDCSDRNQATVFCIRNGITTIQN